MEDTRIASRELQATTERNNDTQTTAMTIQVDLGSLRALRPVTCRAKIPTTGKFIESSQIAPRVRSPVLSSDRAEPTFSEPSS